MGAALREMLAPGAKARFVSAYFSIYGYGELREELARIKSMRFLFGDPDSIADVDPGSKAEKAFVLTEDGIGIAKTIEQKFLARACEEWMRGGDVEVRAIRRRNFLHGKMYHAESDADERAIVGSSNFTRRGLGMGQGANLELNLSVAEERAKELREWFDALWNGGGVEDAKEKALTALNRLGREYAPEAVYYKTLFEIFRDELEAGRENESQMEAAGLYDSAIWKALYSFQRDAAPGIINRLNAHGGCVLADSVGLGKTYTALAVIKYFESRNQRVLVLCPKKLEDNWALYPIQNNHNQNPFADDRFGFVVLAHSDLSRFEGRSGQIDLARFNWGNFDLIVIDESHNFRNDAPGRRDEQGEIERRSRYGRLLEEAIKKGAKTKVLMLSATPVNTSLIDLRNQIYLMTAKRRDAFSDSLGIRDLQSMMGAAQKQFRKWEDECAQASGPKDKSRLLDILGGDFFRLLGAVSIARSRRLIKKHYATDAEKIGGFPKRAKPIDLYPPTDNRGELSYERLSDKIGAFTLSVYQPSAYLRVDSEAELTLTEEKEKYRYNQRTREQWLIGMIRVNFLKRLESSADALALTLARVVETIKKLEARIAKYIDRADDDGSLADDSYDDEDDDDFVVNKARHPFHFRDMRLEDWLEDLRADRVALEAAHADVAKITPERDGKLEKLRAFLAESWENPRVDRDGGKNRKVLVFTAFKDTADYLYKNLRELAEEKGARIAMVAGSVTRAGWGKNDYNEILTNFAPLGRGRYKRDENGAPIADGKPEIDWLIATDCVSEGQNLQDCDTVVNYDIHWNPVRLIQRFGRIDRIGARNLEVRMIRFWPMKELDKYLKLEGRVQARMALLDLTATGDENPFAQEDNPVDPVDRLVADAQTELDFRDSQLRRLRDEVLDLEDLGETPALSDFTLDDFFAQLLEYLRANKEELEKMPLGVCAVVGETEGGQRRLQTEASAGAGAIFLLRQKNAAAQNPHNPRHPHYVGHVRDDGTVYYPFPLVKRTLAMFADVARDKKEPSQGLCDAFARATENGKRMEKYTALAGAFVGDIAKRFAQADDKMLGLDRGAKLAPKTERPRDLEDFELVSWLVIKEEEK